MSMSSCIMVCDFVFELDTILCVPFWLGALSGFVVALLAALIYKCNKMRKFLQKGISIEASPNGASSITRRALVSFVRHVVLSFDKIELIDVILEDRTSGLALLVIVRANPDIAMATSLNKLREKIVGEMADKLGITEQIKSVDFETKDVKIDGE